jgi:methyl-accepting chemotaxis protein
MGSWWTKLVAMFRGEPADTSSPIPFPCQQAENEVCAGPTLDRAAAQAPDADAVPQADLAEAPVADRRAPDLCELISNLIATFERHLSPLAAQAGRTAEIAEHLLAKADTGAEQIHCLEESTAALREITSAAAESLGNLADRLESLDENAARLAELMAHSTREIEEIKSKLDQLTQAMTRCLETCAEIAGHQEQMSTAFASMRELTEQGAEAARAGAVTIKSMADDRGSRYDELRAHLTEKYRRLAARNTIALLLSAIAAIAALTAAVLVALEHP